MAKITGKYEVLYIIDPTLGEEGTEHLWKSSRQWWKQRAPSPR